MFVDFSVFLLLFFFCFAIVERVIADRVLITMYSLSNFKSTDENFP